MKNKRGLSTIVITVILIALALVAIGIVWAVVNGLLVTNKQTLDINQKCMGTQISVVSATCSGADTQNCSLTLKRTGSESSDMGGIKVVFLNTTESTVGLEDFDKLSQLQTKTKEYDTGLTNVNAVQVTPFFKDASGKELICPNSVTKEIGQ